jgi:hypothetical protein
MQDRIKEIRDRSDKAIERGWGAVVDWTSHSLQDIPYLLDALEEAQEEIKELKTDVVIMRDKVEGV